jgi:molybdopterin-guanine dinucleotide biosynthesis protein A
LADSPPQVVAVILAGGEGRRLGGVIKANIEIGDRRLLFRVADALGACAIPILVAHGRIDPSLLALPAGFQPVPDLQSDYRGPLAGLAGAQAWLEAQGWSPDFVATAAVDTPFFPPNFVAEAVSCLTDARADAVIARCAGQDYPTNAVWRLASVSTLAERVLQGSAPHILKRLGVELGAHYLDWPADAGIDPFANINTPEDMQRLSAHASALSNPR